MSGSTPSRNESRLLELLADRALCGLTEAEQKELEALCQEHLASPGCPLEFCELDAAVAEVAMTGPSGEGVPESVRARLERAADRWCSDNCPIAGSVGPGTARAVSGLSARLGWLAAAACLALAVWTWTSNRTQNVPVGERLERFERESKDIRRAEWAPFNALDETKAPPAQTGVTGKVVWSESSQTGFITFKGIKPNDPNAEQYQLWIVDSRGLGQRISGALFNAVPDPATGEVIVPIEPRIAVDKAAIFAVTIEKPGGTWVSDMSRRVVLAQLQGG